MNAGVKGLEPIVAAVLLIVVAVIGAVLVYLWFAGYVTKSTSQAEQLAASEKLKIEAASLTTGGDITLYVRNLGGTPVTINTIYVFTPGTTSPICYKDGVGKTISPGAMDTVSTTVTCTASLSAGSDYVIKIVTARGTEAAVTVAATAAAS
jgi:type II secretory pathway pseudopilin PulG